MQNQFIRFFVQPTLYLGGATLGLVGLRQKTNREKPQLQSPLGIYFEKPKIAETQIYQGKS
ncbi:unknown protein [Microcystis aeruginosa NIES-843]|uniref:Uncharacterized protein n=1 Tax=Microcystis aeruginosa (strain NIES-843 / IAM M-2473) TaxID=449447 RepID=B0JVL2_MICAN|nr:unknown protein [Microcystis aeruginosa NIES-843]